MDEQQFKPAWRSFYGHFIAIIILLAAAGVVSVKWMPAAYQQWLWRVTVAVAVCIAISLLCKRNNALLIVKPDKVSLETGLVGRQSVEVNMRSIRSIQIRQSILQRILNVGDIMVVSAGDEYEIIAANMPSPHEIRESIHLTGRDGPGDDRQQEA